MKLLRNILVFVSIVTLGGAKKFGNHKFPHKDKHGVDIVNEFQLVNPQSIKISMTKGYEISISPLVIDSGDNVEVSFLSENPQIGDWIGAYSPADVDVKKQVPIKLGWCDDDNDYLTTGRGKLAFNFTNVRNNIAFYLFKGDDSQHDWYTPNLEKSVLVAQAKDQVAFKHVNKPMRPRLVPTGDPDQFSLLWSSASSASPALRWGLSPAAYTNTVAASTQRLTKDDLCGEPATTIGWFDLGLIHTAPITGMRALANQKIYYIFGDEATNDFSEEHFFFVPPVAGTQPPTRPTTVLLYDDMGRGTNDQSFTWYEYGRASMDTAQMVAEEVARGTVDAIYHGGDISYASGFLSVWDFFLDMLAPVASRVLYLTTVGNHESDWVDASSLYSNRGSGGECTKVAMSMIPMPAPATVTAPWWSYDVGLLHLVGISTEHNFSTGSPQHQWLEADLKAVDRSVTPWVIFGGHRAMYLNSNWTGRDDADMEVMDEMIKHLEPLLFKYKVNLGFYGHNHVVQRHAAVYQRRVVQRSVPRVDPEAEGLAREVHWQEDPQAPVHLVIGTAGADFTVSSVDPKPDWNEVFFYQYGYSRLVAHNASFLSWEWIDSQSGVTADRMVITQKDPSAPFRAPA